MSIREIWTQSHFAERAYQIIIHKATIGNTDILFSSIHSFLSHCVMVSKMLVANDQSTHGVNRNAVSLVYALFSCSKSFLLCCAKALKIPTPVKNTPSTSIGDILGIPTTSLIHKRTFRNHLEHYDERLKRWIRRYGANSMVGTYNVGPKSMFKLPNMIYVRHYDPSSQTFTFVNEDFNLSALGAEVVRIKGLADNWVKDMEQQKIVPPFG